MPQGIGYPQAQVPQQPQGGNQGLDEILQALAMGGQPLGEIANMPSAMPANPNAIANVNPMQGQVGNVLDQVTPEQLQMIIEALSQGAFNSAPNTGT